MRLYGQLPVKIDNEHPALSLFVEAIIKGFEQVKRSDTEIVIRPLKGGPSKFENLKQLGFSLFDDQEVFRSILDAGNGEFDGVIVLCGFDPALEPAREQLNIPVVGIFESSVHLAAKMGRKFAVITSEPAYIKRTEQNIHKYKMDGFAISETPVRSIPLSTDGLIACVIEDDYLPLIREFEKVSAECINNGAETLIAGCGMLSTMLTYCGFKELRGVPVIDPLLVGVKVGELMVDLQKTDSNFRKHKGSFYESWDFDADKILDPLFG